MTAAARPLPRVDGDAKPFWDATRAGRLVLQRCTACGTWRFPPGLVCRSCASTSAEWVPAAGRGHLHAVTVVHRTPIAAFRDDVPYFLGLVDLDEGVRLMARLAPADRPPPIGARLELAFEHVDDEVTLPTFREVSDG
jgi:uncharacterized OB-fold protein